MFRTEILAHLVLRSCTLGNLLPPLQEISLSAPKFSSKISIKIGTNMAKVRRASHAGSWYSNSGKYFCVGACISG